MKDNIINVGVNDHITDLFEGQYKIPNGMAYNSFVILDEKIAVISTVDQKFKDMWLDNIAKALNGKKPRYLIIQHVEPDHSGSINDFMKKYPNTTIVSSPQGFMMMNQFFGKDYKENRIVISDAYQLNLGVHNLECITAPMVHWPEVFFMLENDSKTLFSADAFGKFGANDVEEEWACEARRYYFGIVGKYGVQVQNVLNKLKGLEIKRICPLHGPVLENNISYYVDLYKTWSSYSTESDGIFIAFTSVYGNTKNAVNMLKDKLIENGAKKVVLCDLARDDLAEAVEDAFRYGKVVFASTTYNNGIFPFMREFLNELVERNFQNKTIAIIDNGTWAPQVERIIKQTFANSNNLKFIEPVIKMLSAPTAKTNEEINTLALNLINS